MALFCACAFLIWPRFWIPAVVRPVVASGHRAKLALAAAPEEREKKQAAASANGAEALAANAGAALVQHPALAESTREHDGPQAHPAPTPKPKPHKRA